MPQEFYSKNLGWPWSENVKIVKSCDAIATVMEYFVIFCADLYSSRAFIKTEVKLNIFLSEKETSGELLL